MFECPDEGGGVTGGRGVQFGGASRPWFWWDDVRPRFCGALYVAAAQRRGERAAGRPREGRPHGEGAEGGAGGRRSVEEVPTHHQRDDRHQERTVEH